MKTKNEPTIETLIKNSFTALKSGDKSTAWKLALKAAELSPKSEQAWLILASLSEPDQALQYLENALRANPNSSAARKGIRLVSNQAAIQKMKSAEKNSSRLDDTAQIPVLIQEDKKPNPGLQASTTPSPVSKKEAFRRKLAKKSKATEDQNLPSKDKIKTRLKKNIQEKAAIAKDIPDGKLPQNEPLNKQRSADLFKARPKDIKKPLVTIKKKKDKKFSKKTDENSSEQFPVWNVFSQRNGKTPEIETYTKAAAPAKTKVKKEGLPPRITRKAKKTIKKSTEMSTQDVDIIELILISLAAILLPLLAFLYFFLKK